ncbi:DUF551 domain-containing protein [Succinimonas sp.]|uniref:DUF551 domain-containing protein n=1 Tax=Succinimonas sp. TaxID=1936151 RepID=UPI00386A55F8
MPTREKLIEKINTKLMALPYGEITLHTAEEIADSLIEEGYVTDTNVGKWISVKDRLPEYGQPVLVCDVREDYVGMAVLQPAKHFVFSKSETYWDWDRMECNLDEFTHWQHLPQPPKGE